MRIGVDAHVIGREKGGAETYAVNLVRELAALRSGDEIVAFVSPEGLDATAPLEDAGVRLDVVPAHDLVRQRFVLLRRRAMELRLDVLHVQRVVPFFLGVPRVVTIHDLAHTLRPDLYDAGEAWPLRLLVAASARRAERILTDSEASRDDIVRTFGVPTRKVTVVPLGIDHATATPDDAGPPTVEGRYVLCVGALETRKNLPLLVEAFARLAAEDDALTLVIAGGERTAGLEARLRSTVVSAGLGGRVRVLGRTDDATLASLYEHAAVFVCPSLVEGFSLPPLEALAHGLPVVASDIPVHREMLGSHAVYADPMDAEAFTGALRTLLAEPQGARAAERRAWAARFRWRSTAERTLAVYREAAAARGLVPVPEGRG